MANTYHQIYLQTVFAVKNRNAVLQAEWREKLFAVIGNLINQNKCKTLAVNGTEDHVHCLLSLKPAISISELMKAVKAKSSKYINDHNLCQERFEWQEGYGVFSYNRKDVSIVFKYIQNQEEHHRMKSFIEEYLELLEEFGVDYDEKYIFKELA